MVVTEGDVTATHAVDAEQAESYDGGTEADETFAAVAADTVDAPAAEGLRARPNAGDSDEPEGDDQLAMFGVVRPTDPEPVKAKGVRTPARRSRKTATAVNTERPKRARKAPARARGTKS